MLYLLMFKTNNHRVYFYYCFVALMKTLFLLTDKNLVQKPSNEIETNQERRVSHTGPTNASAAFDDVTQDSSTDWTKRVRPPNHYVTSASISGTCSRVSSRCISCLIQCFKCRIPITKNNRFQWNVSLLHSSPS
jgi:hypothetical protein